MAVVISEIWEAVEMFGETGLPGRREEREAKAGDGVIVLWP